MRRTWTAAVVFVAAAAPLPAGAAASETVYAVAGGNLIRFDSNSPDKILSSQLITGHGGDALLGLDFRPTTGELYAAGASDRLYRLDPGTGGATAVTAAPFAPGLSGVSFGMDFNPVLDRIRLVSDADQNIRLNPVTGLVSAVDADLAYMSGGANPSVVAAAYTDGAAAATLYGIDSAADSLVRIGGPDGSPAPDSGQLTTIGPLGLNVTGATGFDIVGGRAFLTTVSGGTPLLATVDLASGRITSSHVIGSPPVAALTGVMAAGVGGVQGFAARMTTVRESAGSAALTVERSGGAGAASVDYRTTDGTATAGLDYTPAAGTVTFEMGQTTKTVRIAIADDTSPEDPEALTVELANPKLGSLGPGSAATVVVGDDDAPRTPPDRTRPVVLVGHVTGRISRAFSIPFSCSEACRTTFRLQPGRRDRRRYRLPPAVARAQSSLPHAGKAKARIALTRASRRRLRRARSLVVTLRATVTDAAGNRTVQSTKLRLRR